jgi:hypothetical protein
MSLYDYEAGARDPVSREWEQPERDRQEEEQEAMRWDYEDRIRRDWPICRKPPNER